MCNTWDKYKVQLISVSVDSVVRAKHKSHLYWPVLFHPLVIMGQCLSFCLGHARLNEYDYNGIGGSMNIIKTIST